MRADRRRAKLTSRADHGGKKEGAFREDVDPDQTYLDIISMSFFIFDHRHTMREILDAEQNTPQRLLARRQHIVKTIISSLCAKL